MRSLAVGLAGLLALASCAETRISDGSTSTRAEVVKAGNYSLRAPPSDASCDAAICPGWKHSVKAKGKGVEVTFLRRYGLATYRWTIVQTTAARGRPTGRATGMTGEQLADLMLSEVEEDVRGGVDIWRAEDIASARRSFIPVNIDKRTVTVGGKTLRRLTWKSVKPSPTLIPSQTIVEGAAYVEIPETPGPASETTTIVSFLLWDQYQSGRPAKDVLAQIEPVIVSFRRN